MLPLSYFLLVSLFFCVFLFFVYLRVEVCRLSSAEAIASVVFQLGKAKDEILSRIAGLEAAAVAGEDLSGPLAELAAAAQALDDVVPDAVVEVPVEVPAEPVVEPVVEGEQV
jgi:hypothetical protein